MDILLNPNIAYLILVFTLMVIVVALLSPGTGLLELTALLLVGVVAWLIFNLSVNWWALALLAVGMIFLIFSIRWPKQKVLLIVSIAALVVGSIFLFPSENTWRPAVNPVLALIVSVPLAIFFWFVFRKILEARQMPPTQSMERLIGMLGEARTEVKDQGTVLIGSELWSARSINSIRRGAQVRVIDRDGFILQVEEVQLNQNETN